MFLYFSANAYDPPALRQRLNDNPAAAAGFRRRFDEVLKDRPIAAEEYSKLVNIEFDTEIGLYRYLGAVHDFLFRNGPFPDPEV